MHPALYLIPCWHFMLQPAEASEVVGGAQEPGETAASEATSVRRQGLGPVFSSLLSVCPVLSVFCLSAASLCSSPRLVQGTVLWKSTGQGSLAQDTGTQPLPSCGFSHTAIGPADSSAIPSELSSGCGGGDLLRNCEWGGGGQRWDWTLGPAPGIHVQGERRLANSVAFVSGAWGGGGSPLFTG